MRMHSVLHLRNGSFVATSSTYYNPLTSWSAPHVPFTSIQHTWMEMLNCIDTSQLEGISITVILLQHCMVFRHPLAIFIEYESYSKGNSDIPVFIVKFQKKLFPPPKEK